MSWKIICPLCKPGEYFTGECEVIEDGKTKCKEIKFHSKKRKTVHDNPNLRRYEPYGLTKKELVAKRRVRGRCKPTSRNLYCRLVRCIKKLEPREEAGEIESAVAVCRASLK